MPKDRRRSTNHSNSSGGSSCSTTAVTGMSLMRVSQNAAHSQPPRWGRTMMAPVPLARAASMCSNPVAVKPASISARPRLGSRNDSAQ